MTQFDRLGRRMAPKGFRRPKPEYSECKICNARIRKRFPNSHWKEKDLRGSFSSWTCSDSETGLHQPYETSTVKRPPVPRVGSVVTDGEILGEIIAVGKTRFQEMDVITDVYIRWRTGQ